ncbi:MAG: hypothetical protein K2N28_03710 [Muribaculaceae bacterium]|nr:hypothetical protein [Muribaculaceae bacterium]
MIYRIYLSISGLSVIALVIAAIWWQSPALLVSLGVIALVSLILGVHAIATPLNAVQNGIYLLRSQDFGSRLRATGQTDADKVIDLFNRLMDTMKEERLRLMEQNLFLTKLTEVSPMGIAVCDFDDNVVETNPAYRRMITPELDTQLASLAPDDCRVIRLATSQIYRCSRLWFMDSGFRRTFYLVELMTDDIIESERNIFNIIVRTIGHEVGNTLGPVTSTLDSLAEIHEDDRVVADAIHGAIKRCDNLLEFVRGYAGVVKLPAPHRESVNFAEELRRMLPSLQALAGNNISLELNIGEKERQLSLDMMLIERAIINIVKNAVESIGDSPNGSIVINLDGTTLCITDNGRGISEENSDKLFTPFFSTKHPDRGLGLMLIADILRKHNARFSLTTDPTTHLTTFLINL